MSHIHTICHVTHINQNPTKMHTTTHKRKIAHGTPRPPPWSVRWSWELILLNHRELEGGGLTGANCEIFHSVAVYCLLDSSVEPGQQPCICARTVSTQAARDHRNHPRLAPINSLFQFSENARKLKG